MGTRDDVLKGFDVLVDTLALVDPELGILAREGILLAKELIEADVDDPVQVLRNLRSRIRTDWRAALAAKFPGG